MFISLSWWIACHATAFTFQNVGNITWLNCCLSGAVLHVTLESESELSGMLVKNAHPWAPPQDFPHFRQTAQLSFDDGCDD